MENKDKKYGFSTKAIHAGEEPDFREGATGDVVKPIHMSSTYARKMVDVPTAGFEYSRALNPTRQALETKLAAIENTKYGLAFASGLAAESTLILALLKSGDHVVASDDLYGGTKRLYNQVMSNLGIKISFADANKSENVEKAIIPETKLIWIESPSNPLLKICNIPQISGIAKRHNLILVADNTFMSPYFQNPVDMGADIVLHSSTKYIGGHSDVVGGSIMLSDDILYEKIKYHQNAIGAVPSPFDCFLTMRGIKTLSLRMEKHNQNALAIAKFLEKHHDVEKVIYPGLSSHPQHLLAKVQARGFGGIVSFEIKGDLNTTKKFLQSLKVFALAESLGGVESLIEHPATMTHASVAAEDRAKLGISDTFIRISVGVEDVNDLINDLEQAFSKLKVES
ncbi:MAG: cystathionine gamma-synthase [Bacteroidota bacterium]|nr:cystathionine gamma-synthase [Bacteroidota bacterium]